MKRNQLMMTVVLAAMMGVAAIATSGCKDSGQGNAGAEKSGEAAAKSEKTVQYTCSMHPEVVQDKPGDCPKCGMKLVEKR